MRRLDQLLANLGYCSRREAREWLDAGRWEIDLAGEKFPASVSLKAPYDPASLRMKS